MSDAIQEWTETAKAKTEVAKAKAEKYKSSYSVDDNSIGNAKDCSIATCVSLLEAIDGVDNATYLKAVEKFREADWREIFIHMSSLRKKACSSSSSSDEEFQDFMMFLDQHEYLKDTKEVRVEEALAMFLIIIGHNVGIRLIADRFQHSLETVDRHFTLTLRAICRLGKELICHTNSPLPSHIVNNPKYFPWFEKCIGTIDGTHISAHVPVEKQVSYRGRKSIVTQNVLCACNFNMMLTFVYAGWEGTANDSRVFLDAITRSENKFPLPKEGEYYVVHSGFPCTVGFLPPFQGERYHLQEYHGRGRQPRGPKELFNYRHSSLRNVIERCFGVLKAWF
ncbi:protein ALP1-like [Ziziphus jujuba]|uniref:Protein ALP1-like n=1 Tax=Ziziphus jujuba TaxID=326968 RepID=A0ABM3ZT11_ZIZJJ|nr:protein ALP1-like [Ziziphus jujuba]